MSAASVVTYNRRSNAAKPTESSVALALAGALRAEVSCIERLIALWTGGPPSGGPHVSFELTRRRYLGQCDVHTRPSASPRISRESSDAKIAGAVYMLTPSFI